MDFPPSLPSPTVSGYSRALEDAVVRSNMETGFARQRRRFTSVPLTAKIRFLFSQEQLADFEDWYATDAFHGAAWFMIDLDNGKKEVRFTKPYNTATNDSINWEVKADIEIRS